MFVLSSATSSIWMPDSQTRFAANGSQYTFHSAVPSCSGSSTFPISRKVPPIQYSLPMFSSMVGSWSNARAKSVNGPTNTRSTFSSDSFKARIKSSCAFNGESCTVIGLCSFKIGSASTVKACILHSFGNGFTGRESEEATFNCLSFSEPNL